MSKIEELLADAYEECPACDGTSGSWCTCEGGKVLSDSGIKLLGFFERHMQTSSIGNENLEIERRW